MTRDQLQISGACALVLLTMAVFGLLRWQAQLPGLPLDVAFERFPVQAGESAWQQFAVPACQPTRLTLPLAQPMLAPGALNASYFVRDDEDRWSTSPVATIRTTLLPGQGEVRLPFPPAVAAARRLVRLKLTPESTAITLKAAPDTDHKWQYVTRRVGYLGLNSLVFRAEYPGARWATPVTCVTGMEFPDLPPAVLVLAVALFCVGGGGLAGLAWRITARS